MQASLSVRGFPEYAAYYHKQIKNCSQYGEVSKGLQKHWCSCIIFLYGVSQIREIWVNNSRTFCDDTKKHSNSAVEYGKEQ